MMQGRISIQITEPTKTSKIVNVKFKAKDYRELILEGRAKINHRARGIIRTEKPFRWVISYRNRRFEWHIVEHGDHTSPIILRENDEANRTEQVNKESREEKPSLPEVRTTSPEETGNIIQGRPQFPGTITSTPRPAPYRDPRSK